jgi:hypothetical protein
MRGKNELKEDTSKRGDLASLRPPFLALVRGERFAKVILGEL